VALVQREVIGALSHAELVDLVLRQHEQLEGMRAALAEAEALIARLEARVRELETRLSLRSSRKGSANQAPPEQSRPTKPRKKRAHGFSRLRSAPTRRVIHALQRCPHCAAPLVGGTVKWTREVIELQPVPADVIEHVYIERRCPRCGRRVVPRAAEVGVVAGRQRLGIELVTLITLLRMLGRLPIRTIQWYVQTFHQVHLSVGSIVGVIDRVAHRAEPVVAQIRQRVRASPVVHADETHWRENGASGFIWTFSTTTARYYVHRDRTKSVVDEVLGQSSEANAFDGVLCTDFYAAYHHYPGLKQRCWAHLLRTLHELKEQYPTNVGLQDWAIQVHGLYAHAMRFQHVQVAERMRAKERFEQQLLELCQPFATDKQAPQRRLCARIQRHLRELFVFVLEPQVPADNNAAERSLRPLVTSRKISGGTRSPAGTRARMVLASVFGTWAARGEDPYVSCRQLLLSPLA
jgi:transposase